MRRAWSKAFKSEAAWSSTRFIPAKDTAGSEKILFRTLCGGKSGFTTECWGSNVRMLEWGVDVKYLVMVNLEFVQS
jgi:hypothetical protein